MADLEARIVVRPLSPEDVEHVKWALYTALAWNPQRTLPPPELTLEHPEAARYHRNWGRAGDFGVVAEADGEVVGVAYGRLFTQEDHGHGYVDDATPEIAVAVREDVRGRGTGTVLMNALADEARAAGIARLSLSVDAENPARRLYDRVGYRVLSVDEGGARMVLELEEPAV